MGKLVVSTIETQNINYDSDTPSIIINSSGNINTPTNYLELIPTGAGPHDINGIPTNVEKVTLVSHQVSYTVSATLQIRFNTASGTELGANAYKYGSYYFAASTPVMTDRDAGVDRFAFDGWTGEQNIMSFVMNIYHVGNNNYTVTADSFNSYYGDYRLGLNGMVTLSGRLTGINVSWSSAAGTYDSGSRYRVFW